MSPALARQAVRRGVLRGVILEVVLTLLVGAVIMGCESYQRSTIRVEAAHMAQELLRASSHAARNELALVAISERGSADVCSGLTAATQKDREYLAAIDRYSSFLHRQLRFEEEAWRPVPMDLEQALLRFERAARQREATKNRLAELAKATASFCVS
jgi:hypothetical protein